MNGRESMRRDDDRSSPMAILGWIRDGFVEGESNSRGIRGMEEMERDDDYFCVGLAMTLASN